MDRINTFHKNRLQEYCQSQNISLPKYRTEKETGPSNIRNFQVKVRVNRQWYLGRDHCSSKKEAEQSAAENAWNSLVGDTSKSTRALPKTIKSEESSHTSPVKREQIEHFPDEYADIEQFIIDKVEACGGGIGSIWAADARGRYQVEISGTYRYCKNVRKHHKNDQIYFLVNPVKRIYYQKCHHRRCCGFRSSLKHIPTDDDD